MTCWAKGMPMSIICGCWQGSRGRAEDGCFHRASSRGDRVRSWPGGCSGHRQANCLNFTPEAGSGERSPGRDAGAHRPACVGLCRYGWFRRHGFDRGCRRDSISRWGHIEPLSGSVGRCGSRCRVRVKRTARRTKTDRATAAAPTPLAANNVVAATTVPVADDPADSSPSTRREASRYSNWVSPRPRATLHPRLLRLRAHRRRLLPRPRARPRRRRRSWRAQRHRSPWSRGTRRVGRVSW